MKLNYCPVCGKPLRLRPHPTEPKIRLPKA